MAEASEGGGLVIKPMEQFLIRPLFPGEDGATEIGVLTYTNSSLLMTLIVLVMGGLFVFGSQGRALIPTRIQSITEVIYEFVRSVLRSSAGEEGLKYFPYIFTLFLFVLGSNLLGLFPYSFTVTSHFAVTVTLALMVWFSITILGFYKHGAGFLKLFVPSDCPPALLILLTPIEIFSYFVRPLSHSVRLGANMLAGHAVLKVFAYFIPPMLAGGVLAFGAVLPIIGMVGMFAFELLVAVVQAYIFTILTCIYLNDALHPHH